MEVLKQIKINEPSTKGVKTNSQQITNVQKENSTKWWQFWK